ncbi:OmpA family protein [Gracilibacillus kekensis]|uniref:OmpA family protein n=1 Tax=Gracilibacillus kekensis TaxID=1027249 RepID=A0A1M7L8Y7_9BACI|nr:OmpA family protein [Gracilibacillus kekensis]SHM74301.1 OmpA family protein [Gracilibacillus kekensis]
MHSNFKKMTHFFPLILCVVLLTACMNAGEDNPESSKDPNASSDENNSANEDQTENVESDSENEQNIPNSEFVIKELNIQSEFTITEIPIGSIFLKSSIDMDSSFEKEVMETLTEFNAVGTEDGAKLTLPEDILFDFDSDELRPEADEAIDQLAQVIDTTDDDVTIVGHTDNKGQDSYNLELSENRANAVLDALADKGVEKNRMTAEGKGASEPIAENTNSDGSDNPEGRQKNRRVEVTVHGFNN